MNFEQFEGKAIEWAKKRRKALERESRKVRVWFYNSAIINYQLGMFFGMIVTIFVVIVTLLVAMIFNNPFLIFWINTIIWFVSIYYLEKYQRIWLMLYREKLRKIFQK